MPRHPRPRPHLRRARGLRATTGLVATASCALLTVAASPSSYAGHTGSEARWPKEVRFATFNASLNRAAQGDLVRDLSTRDNAQANAVAEIIQRSRPDVLLINEFDYVKGGRAAELFRDNYLEVGHRGAAPIDYPYYYIAPVNTGVPSGMDLNNDGTVGGPDDAYGFGLFPGQYGMVVYSTYPINKAAVRSFQKFLWKDMPGALLPDNLETPRPKDWYSAAELNKVRLSSKSHWDVPVHVGTETIHFLASHPTPPVFDGEEDRNGRRNHDEVRLWADYISSGQRAAYLYDDKGRRGGLAARARFVIAGDMNTDPRDGDSLPGAIQQLLDHRKVNDNKIPTSAGAVEATALQGGPNLTHQTPAAQDTADFAEPPGNLRVDYVLPSRNLPISRSGVFWPKSSSPWSDLTGTYPFPSSDHRLVWRDVQVTIG